jgi:hypothetical protein
MSDSLRQNGHPTVTEALQVIPNSKQALSSIARTIVDVALGRQPLPDHLFGYVPLVQVLAAGGLGAYRYHSLKINQQSRAKIQLAVFLIIRIVENQPDYGILLQNRNRTELFARLNDELNNIYGNPMSLKEKECVIKEFKRKISQQELPDPPAKRQRFDDESRNSDEEQAQNGYQYEANEEQAQDELHYDTNEEYFQDEPCYQAYEEQFQNDFDDGMTDAAIELSMLDSDNRPSTLSDSDFERSESYHEPDTRAVPGCSHHAQSQRQDLDLERIPAPPSNPRGQRSGYTFYYLDEDAHFHGSNSSSSSEENYPQRRRGFGFRYFGEVEEDAGNNDKRDDKGEDEHIGKIENKEKTRDRGEDQDKEIEGYEDAEEDISSSSFSSFSSSDGSSMPRPHIHARAREDTPAPARQESPPPVRRSPDMENLPIVQRAEKRAFDPNSLGNIKGRIAMKRLYPWLVTRSSARAVATDHIVTRRYLSHVEEANPRSSVPDARSTQGDDIATNRWFSARRLVCKNPRSRIFLSGDLPIVPVVNKKKTTRHVFSSKQRQQDKQEKGEGVEEEELKQLQEEQQLPQAVREHYGQDMLDITMDYSSRSLTPIDEELLNTPSGERSYDRPISISSSVISPFERSLTQLGPITRSHATARPEFRSSARSLKPSRTASRRTAVRSPPRAPPRCYDHSTPAEGVTPVPATSSPPRKRGRPRKTTNHDSGKSGRHTLLRKSARSTAFKGSFPK